MDSTSQAWQAVTTAGEAFRRAREAGACGPVLDGLGADVADAEQAYRLTVAAAERAALARLNTST